MSCFSYLEKRELCHLLFQVDHLLVVVSHCHPQTVTFQLHAYTNMCRHTSDICATKDDSGDYKTSHLGQQGRIGMKICA